jgi:hypothetical protein
MLRIVPVAFGNYGIKSILNLRYLILRLEGEPRSAKSSSSAH